MIVFLNGQFVPEEQAVVSVFDRSFLYGDGLFESLRVYGGVPFRWAQHWQRLERGAEFLRIRLPFTSENARASARELIARNQLPDALLRLSLSRGVGLRGYSPRGAEAPTFVMTLHPAPPRTAAPPEWKLIIATSRVPAGESLATFKTCNKLPQVLARAEADERGADEALLLNTNGELAEAASSNLFWIENGEVHTTPLASGILAGVTREFIFELGARLGLRVAETDALPESLRRAEGVFVTLSTVEVAEAIALDGQPLRRSPIVARLAAAYREAAAREASAGGAPPAPRPKP